MYNSNITIEEYIRLEEEKAHWHGKVYNWETAKYGKIWYDEDVHDLRSVETKFPAIVFNDELSSEKTLSCEPTVSSLNNNEIDFRISFDESDDEDYMVIFDKNLFSHKIISANDLKTDSENDNEKVKMPSFPSPEPKVNCFDDLDFFKDFENEFPAIVYNDALTSKSEYLTEPTLCPQHIDDIDLKYETSLFEYDEVEQNVLYITDLFLFNIIYPDNLKSDKDNDNNEIDIIQSSRGNVNTHGQKKLLEASHNKIFNEESFIKELKVNIITWNYLVNGMLLNLIKNLYVPFGISFDPKRYYKDGVYTRILRRPRSLYGILLFHLGIRGRIYGREIHQVWVFDFRGLTELMDEGLRGRILMEHRDAQGQSVSTSRAWRRLFEIRGSLVHELILEFFSTFRFRVAMLDLDTAESARQILDKGDLSAYWIGISSGGDFLGTAPSYTFIRDPMLRLCHRLIACNITGRSQAPKKVTMTDLFYLRGMDVGSVNIPYLLARYLRLFASGRKRGEMISGGQFVTAAGAPEAAEDGPVVDEGAPAVPAPVQAPQPPPTAGPAQTITQRLARVE
ncbi:hypothetical protein Tco_0077601 [Tanacetum coccineum]